MDSLALFPRLGGDSEDLLELIYLAAVLLVNFEKAVKLGLNGLSGTAGARPNCARVGICIDEEP